MKRITLIRAQKNQANRQKINTRNYTSYEIHKQTIIIENDSENPKCFSWDTKTLKWVPYSNKFTKFSTSGPALIPANAPQELAAISTVELINE